SIMKLPLADRSMALKAYHERLDALKGIQTLPKALKTPQTIGESLMKQEILSLFGWTSITVDTMALLVCTACHRRIGLWSFEKEEEKVFDVISEHRDYCPWINSTSQASVEAGWELLYGCLGLATAEKTGIQDALDVRLNRLRSVFGLKTVVSGFNTSPYQTISCHWKSRGIMYMAILFFFTFFKNGGPLQRQSRRLDFESLMSEWTQIAYGSIHKYGDHGVPITTTCFDEHYELVWVGNEKVGKKGR
ncbi:hypothetical protein PCK1_003198, partial [Pneumocystis canis]